jgi:phosphoribosylaminoimidazole-succinocarboxamide synthase
MEKDKLIELIGKTVKELETDALPAGGKLYKGKVRDVVDLGDKLLIYTSDRISAFDKVLTTIPCKGEVLNRLSVYWFEQTKDIMPNHIIKQVSPRAVLTHKCTVLPLELVVRGYLTGSAWRDYTRGNAISGIKLKEGMQYNQKLDAPILTPSTKAETGHDLPISKEEILKQQLVSPALWEKMEKFAMALFDKATRLAARQGLILVDTKFEFGMLNGQLICVDEIFTPDSSRYWFTESYRELFEKGEEQKRFDKEYLRKWLMDHNFMGDGAIPPIPEDIRAEVAIRYIGAFEKITGTVFRASEIDKEEELELLSAALA